ncbi:MAG: helix-turn-helix domain-containing protein [Lachnospiraceae bacterium]|nr:helix-turn-helix domain-containing protein [Lachnospiraceae bacterium]
MKFKKNDNRGDIMLSTTFQGDLVHTRRILYTPSDFAKTNLLHLQEVGRLTATKPHTSRRSGLNSYLFFVVENGNGSLAYNGKENPLQKGDCVFIDCSQPYAHTTADHLWTLSWVHFYGPNMSAIYDKYLERGGSPRFTPMDAERYLALVESLYSIADADIHLKDMKIYEKLTGLLTFLMEDSWRPTNTVPNQKRKRSLQDVKEYLDANYQRKITLDELSKGFYIDKYYLTKLFKEQYGVSVVNYLMQMRITNAKRLLRFTDLPVEKIGIECGFDDPNYFARAFGKVEGCSPTEYRKRW